MNSIKSPITKIFSYNSKAAEATQDPSYATQTYHGGKKLFKGVASASKGMASMFYSKFASMTAATPAD